MPACVLYEQSSRSRQINPFRRVHFYFFTFIDEWRNLHNKPGLSLGGLGHAGRRRALQSRLSLEYGQLYRLRQFNSHRFAVVELHSDLQVGNEVINGIAENIAIEVK